MKRMKNLFILLTMLLVGSSFGVTSNANKTVVADAAEEVTTEPTYAFFTTGWKTKIEAELKKRDADATLGSVLSVLITNDASKIPSSGYLEGFPMIFPLSSIESDYLKTKQYTSNRDVNAYVSLARTTEEGVNLYDCVFYADADNFYVYDGGSLFSDLTSAEKITFDFKNDNGRFVINGPENVDNPNTMTAMFLGDANLVQIEGLTRFDTTKVTKMNTVFNGCNKLTSLDVSSFNTANVTLMNNMFNGCKSLTSINGLNNENFITSNVTSMAYMFGDCHKLTSLDLSNFNTANVETMDHMFSYCHELATIKGFDGENWNTAKVASMRSLFSKCQKLSPIDVSNFETKSVTDMMFMFEDCDAVETITGFDSPNWDTSNVTNMAYMFLNCTYITSLDVTGFETKSVENMNCMFGGCGQMTTINGLNSEGWDTSNVTNMTRMFNNCYALQSVDVSGFDTSKVTNLSYMFFNCWNLKTLDLSNFDLKSITNENTNALTKFISTATGLEEIKTPANMNGNTIALPTNFGMSEIEPTMESMTLIKGSKELNTLYNTLKTLKTCEEYMKGADLLDIYNGLSAEEKGKFATLKDDDGVSLIDKLTYMVSYAATKADSGSATAGKNMVSSAIASQSPVLVVLIGCISVAFIGGYYFAQKRKYAK